MNRSTPVQRELTRSSTTRVQSLSVNERPSPRSLEEDPLSTQLTRGLLAGAALLTTALHGRTALAAPLCSSLPNTLYLQVGVLPCPDGSSAFLTGSLAGEPTRLPRGEYAIELRFDAAIAGLPSLRPSVLVGPGSEIVRYRFIQPYGATWPLPSGKSGIRHDLVDMVVRLAKLDPKIWEEAVLRDLPAEQVEARLRSLTPASNETIAQPMLPFAIETAGTTKGEE